MSKDIQAKPYVNKDPATLEFAISEDATIQRL